MTNCNRCNDTDGYFSEDGWHNCELCNKPGQSEELPAIRRRYERNEAAEQERQKYMAKIAPALEFASSQQHRDIGALLRIVDAFLVKFTEVSAQESAPAKDDLVEQAKEALQNALERADENLQEDIEQALIRLTRECSRSGYINPRLAKLYLDDAIQAVKEKGLWQVARANAMGEKEIALTLLGAALVSAQEIVVQIIHRGNESTP